MANETAFGIDLGTTFSVVAHLDAEGRPWTIPSVDGDAKTPSVVFFDKSDVIVGREALKAAEFEPERVARFVKRDMGRELSRGKYAGRQFPPEVIQAFVLQKLKEDAALKLGEVRKTVITVPAYFDEPRRKATQDAGRIAGLDVLDIINEPTAAAISYGVQQQFLNAGGESTATETILVYDLGGGTFDATLMQIDGKHYETLATGGDVYLGGVDWDQRLADWLAGEFKNEHGVDIHDDAGAWQKLLQDAEAAKHALTAREETSVMIAHDGQRSRISVSRDKFHELTADLLDRTAFTVKKVLREAGKQWSDLTRLLLVGGSTRMPAVTEMLERESGLKVDRSLSPDEAVAHGAAVYAGLLMRHSAESLKDLSVSNVNSHDLGVVGVETASGRKRRHVMIPRNTKLPAEKTNRFTTYEDGQDSVLVNVVEGGDSTGENATVIGRCVVRELPPNLPKGTKVLVKFRYHENGRLEVLASLPDVGKQAVVNVERASGLTGDDIQFWHDQMASGKLLDTLSTANDETVSAKPIAAPPPVAEAPAKKPVAPPPVEKKPKPAAEPPVVTQQRNAPPEQKQQPPKPSKPSAPKTPAQPVASRNAPPPAQKDPAKTQASPAVETKSASNGAGANGNGKTPPEKPGNGKPDNGKAAPPPVESKPAATAKPKNRLNDPPATPVVKKPAPPKPKKKQSPEKTAAVASATVAATATTPDPADALNEFPDFSATPSVGNGPATETVAAAATATAVVAPPPQLRNAPPKIQPPQTQTSPKVAPPKPAPQTAPTELEVDPEEDDHVEPLGLKVGQQAAVFGVSLALHLVVFLVLGFLVIPSEIRDAVLGTISSLPDPPKQKKLENVKIEKPKEMKDEDTEEAQIVKKVLADSKEKFEIDVDDINPPSATIDVNPNAANPSAQAPNRGKFAGRSKAGRAALIAKYGGNAASESAVVRGLEWLKRHQNSNGSWSWNHQHRGCNCPSPGSFKKSHTGATAMATMCFLGHGDTYAVGDYQPQVRSALMYLLKNERKDKQGQGTGDFRGDFEANGGMYIQGLVTIVLCEALAMNMAELTETTTAELRRKLKKLKSSERRKIMVSRAQRFKDTRMLGYAALRAIHFIARAQSDNGGWRYTPRRDADTSVVGWQVMALASGHSAKIRIPAATLQGVTRYLDAAQVNEYGTQYAYTIQQKKGKPSMTAVGLLCRIYMGWKRTNPGLSRGVEYLSGVGPSRNNMYYNYYATQVMHQYGGPMWKKWNGVMRDQLVDSQLRKGHASGSWNVTDPHGRAGGRLYQTCLSIMTLEVYYRHLPLYKHRNVDDDSKDKDGFAGGAKKKPEPKSKKKPAAKGKAKKANNKKKPRGKKRKKKKAKR